MSHRHSPRSFLGRIASVICLGAYLCGAMEFFPEVLALVCSMDPSHTVYVIRGESDLRIVLSHEKGRTTGEEYRPDQDPSSGVHRHGLAASVVCSLARNPDAGMDHEALFGVGGLFEATDDDPLKARPMPPLAGFWMACVLSEPDPTRPLGWDPVRLEMASSQGPPVLLRTTVLLI